MRLSGTFAAVAEFQQLPWWSFSGSTDASDGKFRLSKSYCVKVQRSLVSSRPPVLAHPSVAVPAVAARYFKVVVIMSLSLPGGPAAEAGLAPRLVGAMERPLGALAIA